MWSSWADFVSSSILLLLLAPVVGHWTDVHGRKPFIVLTCLAAAPPVLCLVLYVQYGLSLMYAPNLPCLGLPAELQPCLHLLTFETCVFASFGSMSDCKQQYACKLASCSSNKLVRLLWTALTGCLLYPVRH